MLDVTDSWKAAADSDVQSNPVVRIELGYFGIRGERQYDADGKLVVEYTFGDDDVSECTISGTMGDSGTVSIGSTEAAQCTITIFSDSLTDNGVVTVAPLDIRVSFGYDIGEVDLNGNPVPTFVEAGVFATNTENVINNGMFTTITAYDMMYWLFDSKIVDGTTPWSKPFNVKDCLVKVAEELSIGIDTTNLVDMTLKSYGPSEGATYRDLIGKMAAAEGCCVSGLHAKLEFIKPSQTVTAVVGEDDYSDISREPTDTLIDCVDSTVTLTWEYTDEMQAEDKKLVNECITGVKYVVLNKGTAAFKNLARKMGNPKVSKIVKIYGPDSKKKYKTLDSDSPDTRSWWTTCKNLKAAKTPYAIFVSSNVKVLGSNSFTNTDATTPYNKVKIYLAGGTNTYYYNGETDIGGDTHARSIAKNANLVGGTARTDFGGIADANEDREENERLPEDAVGIALSFESDVFNGGKALNVLRANSTAESDWRDDITTIANNMFGENGFAAGGIRYYGGSVSLFGRPYLTLGDRVQATDVYGNTFEFPIYSFEWRYNGTFSSTYGANGVSESSSGSGSQSVVSTGSTNSTDSAVAGLNGDVNKLRNLVVSTIDGDNAKFNNIVAGTVTSSKVFADNVDASYVRTDTANIGTAWVQDLLVKGAIIDDTTTMNLTSVHINANSIDAGTLSVDRLILTGDDGEKYLAKVEPDGTLHYEKLDGGIIEDKTISADKIVANSITTEQITVDNLVGVSGWINLSSGTFGYVNTENGYGITWDGTTLTLDTEYLHWVDGVLTIGPKVGDNLKISPNKLDIFNGFVTIKNDVELTEDISSAIQSFDDWVNGGYVGVPPAIVLRNGAAEYHPKYVEKVIRTEENPLEIVITTDTSKISVNLDSCVSDPTTALKGKIIPAGTPIIWLPDESSLLKEPLSIVAPTKISLYATFNPTHGTTNPFYNNATGDTWTAAWYRINNTGNVERFGENGIGCSLAITYDIEGNYAEINPCKASDSTVYGDSHTAYELMTEESGIEGEYVLYSLGIAGMMPATQKNTGLFFKDDKAYLAYNEQTDTINATAMTSNSAMVNPVGAIQMFGGKTAPMGWLMCDGSEVLRSAYPKLFDVIGTTYGTGDGITTFNLPDLCSRVPFGSGKNSTNNTTVFGEVSDGEYKFTLGKRGGEYKHLLTDEESGQQALSISGGAHGHNIRAEKTAATGTAKNHIASSGTYTSGFIATTGGTHTHSVSKKNATNKHNNIPPYTVVNFIICTGA